MKGYAAKCDAEVPAVAAPRFLVLRHTARFPRRLSRKGAEIRLLSPRNDRVGCDWWLLLDGADDGLGGFGDGGRGALELGKEDAGEDQGRASEGARAEVLGREEP